MGIDAISGHRDCPLPRMARSIAPAASPLSTDAVSLVLLDLDPRSVVTKGAMVTGKILGDRIMPTMQTTSHSATISGAGRDNVNTRRGQ